MPEYSRIWWKSITGPKNLCDAVADVLLDGSNVCLIVPDDLPWRVEMRTHVEMIIRQDVSMDLTFEFIDVEDDCPCVFAAIDVGRYLLKKYAEQSVATGYRARKGYTIQEYILDNHVLDKRVLWIKGMNKKQEDIWLDFCRSYRPADVSDGKFVLETRWTDKVNDYGKLSVIRYSDKINQNDLSLFNNLYLNGEKREYSPLWQQYAATLCSILCKTDAETSMKLMDRCDFRKEDPKICISEVAEDEAFQQRGKNNTGHILSLVRDKDQKRIEKLIWEAQLQVIFPLIEIERLDFIDRYRESIKNALEEEYYDKTHSAKKLKNPANLGQPYDEPEEVEIGTIHLMITHRLVENSLSFMLYVPDEQARRRVELLRGLRNTLAHLRICPIEEIAEFINGHPYDWR